MAAFPSRARFASSHSVVIKTGEEEDLSIVVLVCVDLLHNVFVYTAGKVIQFVVLGRETRTTK